MRKVGGQKDGTSNEVLALALSDEATLYFGRLSVDIPASELAHSSNKLHDELNSFDGDAGGAWL